MSALLPMSVDKFTPGERMLFRKRGGHWEHRFQGKNTLLLQGVDKGAEYINLLLAHPGREASVHEVVCGYALSAADSVSDAFRNAVNRAITAIGKYDKPPAEHLKASIKHGDEVVYRPGIPVTRDVRPIVNE